MNSTYEVDFYKQFKLVPPICGLVNKVISPKGIRKQETETYYYYKLDTELCGVYEDKPMSLKPGLYWVLDVCKVMDKMTWNHYLFVVSKKGNIRPIAEYLYQSDSSWVKQALKVVKSYYNKEKPEAISLTPIKYKESRKETHWKSSKF